MIGSPEAKNGEGSGSLTELAREGAGAVVLDQVSKSFRGPTGVKTVVHELSLSIRPGEFFSLLGPSGCGKTTTLRMIAGLERVDSGRILLGGVDATNLAAHARNVNTVFQNYALFPHLNVFDNVAYGLRRQHVHKEELRKRVLEALALVHMDAFPMHRSQQLSGGQQQRIALARAIVTRPTVLLLDEPLAALDLKLRESMQEELKRLQRELQLTFVFVTHDQAEAFAMSDRVAVMEGGALVQVGSPEELYLRPATRFVTTFVGRANFIVRGRALGLEPAIFEAANDLGARTLTMLRTIAVPLLAPALIAGGLLSFTFSLEDLVTSVFVSTAQTTPLPVYILASLHSQFHADIFAVAVILFATTTLLFLFALAAMGGGSRSRMRRGLRILGSSTAAGSD